MSIAAADFDINKRPNGGWVLSFGKKFIGEYPSPDEASAKLREIFYYTSMGKGSQARGRKSNKRIRQ